jgi:glycosyltransferase involved in cell wall biosynthesis
VNDVLLVSLGSTVGLRAADDELAQALRRAGASVAVAEAARQPDVRTFALTDFLWARAARSAAVAALGREPAAAVVYSTVTAALLWPVPGAIRFDAPAAANRPGRHGVWQRPLERRRLAQTPLLLPSSHGALAEAAGAGAARPATALVVPVPVEPSGPPAPVRDIAAVTYGANPHKKGLDRVLDAWARVRRPGEELVVAGVDVPAAPGVRVVGMIDRAAYRGLLRRARLYLSAPRREDYGIAQLEALADGCALVTTIAPGPYVALELARRLDPRLVTSDLAPAIRLGLDSPRPDYAAAAAAALHPFSRAGVDRLVAEQVLPRLLAPAPTPTGSGPT